MVQRARVALAPQRVRRAWRGLVAALLLLLAAGFPALATTGGIRVVVLDAADGTPLPGASVTLSNDQQLVQPYSDVADAGGMVLFPVLRAGAGYRLEIAMPGFGAQRRIGLRVRSNETAQYVVQLGAEIAERVRVSGESQVVDLNQVGSETRFDDEFIDGLPRPGRFYQTVLPLAPGVNDEDGDGNPNVHGARTRNFRAEVSGVSNVDPLTGKWLNRVNPDSIEEIQVVPLGAGVEFGRAQGGFARVVQKQGTNSFEGVFNFVYRSSKLDGDGAGSTGAGGAPAFDSYEPSLQLSGPIVKDRLWYRLSHDLIRREDPVNVLNDLAVIRREQAISADQLTWQVSPRHKLALQYQSDPLTLDNFGISSSVPAESTQTLETGGDTWSLGWTAPYSPRLLVDSLVAYQDTKQDLVPTAPGATQDCVAFANLLPLNAARCIDLSTAQRTSGRHYETSKDQRQRLTVRSQLTLYRSLGSHSHQLKFGLVVENERYFRDLERRPDITFTVIDDGLGAPRGLAQAEVAIPQTSAARATGNSWALYAEDQWRPRNNLSVTFGARVDREEIDAYGHSPFDPTAEAQAFERAIDVGDTPANAIRRVFTAYEDVLGFRDELAFIMAVPESLVRLDPVSIQSQFWPQARRSRNIRIGNTNVSPRLTAAWDPWSNGKTKVSLSAGRYFDKIFLAVPLVELEPIETTINFEAQIVDGTWSNFDRDLRTSPLSARMIDRDLGTPYQDELTFSVEREIFAETSLRATWVKRRFKDQLQDVDINHATGDYGRCVRPIRIGDPIVIGSPGEGAILPDPYAGGTYVDTDPGRGDGRIDDCTGDVVQIGGTLGFQRDVPDGRPDLYVQNPGWREILLFGNFNTQDYEAIVLELVRRQYRNWELQGSYTWSESVGDAEDFNLILGNEQNLRDDERGYVDHDQRHVVKVNATTLTPWLGGVRLGGVVRWESGLPYSLLNSRLTTFSTPPLYFDQGERDLRARLRYPTGQRNDQRNESFWTFDVLLAKEFRLGRGTQMQITAEAFNILNDDSLRVDELTNGVISGTRRFGRQWQLRLRLGF